MAKSFTTLKAQDRPVVEAIEADLERSLKEARRAYDRLIQTKGYPDPDAMEAISLVIEAQHNALTVVREALIAMPKEEAV